LEFEDSRAVAVFYAQQEILEKEIETLEDVIKKVDAVTLKDIDRVVGEYFKEDGLNLAIIGNFSNRQSFEKLLKF